MLAEQHSIGDEKQKTGGERDYPPMKSTEVPPKLMPFLDLLRFVAAVLVMLNHLRVEQFAPFSEVHAGSTVLKTVFFCATRIGLESVLMFFVLSGFLVGGMSVERAMNGRFMPGKYFIDRFSRIYTPLAPALAFDVAVCLCFGIGFSWLEAGVNLVSMQGVAGRAFSGNTALWSLSYEVWFYILAGALLMLAGRQGRAARVGPLLVVAAGFLVFLRLDPAYLFAWLIGVACYFLGAPARPRIFWLTAVTLSAAGLVLMQVTSQSAQVELKAFSFVDRSFAVLIFALGLGLLVSAFAHLDPASPMWQRITAWGTNASKFSYSLYLFHIPVIIVLLKLHLLQRQTTLSMVTLCVYLAHAALILVLSYLFYMAFEKRTPLVRDFLYRKLLPGPKPATAITL